MKPTKDEALEAMKIVENFLAIKVEQGFKIYTKFETVKLENDWVEAANLLQRLKDNY